MEKITLVTSVRELKPGIHWDPITWDLEMKICEESLRNAIQMLITTKDFDNYISRWQSV